LPEIEIMIERCVCCGDCIRRCPQSGGEVELPVLVRDGDGHTRVRDSIGCIACYTCVEYCRAAAISIGGERSRHEDGRPEVYPTRPVSRII
jgi:formate hydrogenlyase subunit 6/NADH:ubiquinone oxidoreductase subunit I